MEYFQNLDYGQKEDFSGKSLLFLGTHIDTGKPVYIRHNPKSERTIISGATGRGKTNVAKLIISQKIRFFAKRFNKKFLILDYKGIDWRTIRFPQENSEKMHHFLDPFGIQDVKIYTPAYDETISFPGDNLFSFYPMDFEYEDWLQGGKSMAIGADELENIRELNPELFDDPTSLIEGLRSGSSDFLKAIKSQKEDYMSVRTKHVLLRTLRNLRNKNILVSKSSTLRNNYQILDDLKTGIVPILQMGETGGKYVQFYSGKILKEVFNARHREVTEKKSEIGYVHLIIEEAPVIFHKAVDIVDNPAAYAIARAYKRGRTFGFSIDAITQSIEELCPVAWKNANNFIISAGCSEDDKKILRNLGVDEYTLFRLSQLRFDPDKGRFEFMYIGNDRKGVPFNAALSPVGTTEE
jgi:DNA helicase HerA-like ATPase